MTAMQTPAAPLADQFDRRSGAEFGRAPQPVASGNGMAEGFRTIGDRTDTRSAGVRTAGRVSQRTGSGVPAVAPSITHSLIGEARPEGARYQGALVQGPRGRTLLGQAIKAEVAEFLAKHADLKTATGQQRVVRHGHLPEREIMTGIGPVCVRQPRVRDREATEGERIRYSPSILPRYARRSKSLEVLIPILYLKGISTGDFEEALAALVGTDAPGLSASTIARLKEAWSQEHARWQKRDLSAKRYLYFWADGIHLEARLEEQAQCILVIIGATPEGRKELVGFTDGIRESSQSWRDLLLDLKRRGLTTAPQIAVADGALGFWKALGEVWPTTREQRCWVHKTANILNKLPKSLHTKAKRALQEIWMAETKKDAVAALEAFVETYQIKYEEVYLHAYGNVAAAKAGIGAWLVFYNEERQHQSHGYRTPRQVYEAQCRWICGVLAWT